MLLKSNRELGQTTLMITHNPEAAAIASRILYMRDGEIVKQPAGNGGPPAARFPDPPKARIRALTLSVFLAIFERFARTPPEARACAGGRKEAPRAG